MPPCTFKQRLGNCERGDGCTFRHQPWSSPQQATNFYASREKGIVDLSQLRYKQLHRGGGSGVAGVGAASVQAAVSSGKGRRFAAGPPSSSTQAEAVPARLGKEHVELGVEVEVEREIQEETYGPTAMRMMAKMGYKPGSGLGRTSQGQTKLIAPCVALEKASQSCVLGLGEYASGAKCTAAERAARLADARARKHRRVGDTPFVQHNLLSDSEDSEGEQALVKAHDLQLAKG